MGTVQQEADYYAVLEVQPSASPEVVRAAYRALVGRWHPDVAPPELHDRALRRTQELNAAWEVLGDLPARSRYDAGRRVFVAEPSVSPEPAPQPPAAVDDSVPRIADLPIGVRRFVRVAAIAYGPWLLGVLFYLGLRLVVRV
jgi:curved DNA-binding protein CbpA